MTETRQDSLFQLPRVIVASLEHVAAVVRLDHDRGATAETFGDERSDVTEIHHGRDLHALVRCGETEIVDGVVWNREGMEIDLADAKVFARLDLFHSIAQSLRAATWLVVADIEALADVSVERLSRDVNGTIEGAEQHAQAPGVIAVFVSDEHCIESLRVFADHCETARDLFCTQARVDKYARVSGNDQDRVTS
jgi:hypothetical protein